MARKKRVSKSRRVRVTKAPSRAIKVQSKILNKVQKNAFDRLSWVKARDTNLYVDSNLLRKGTTINASHQRIRLQRDTVMVFADDAPLYNWGHPCRYLLYDGKSGELYSKTNAEFPPNLAEPEATLKAFHQPVAAVREARYRVAKQLDWATLAGAKLMFYVRGKRFAVLFSGASNNRHTNDLEFLYRALIDVYGFDPNNVYVLNYDGGINYSGSPKPVGNWPGDDTAYRMPVHAAGTKAELENVFDDLKTRLGSNDLLFVHTNNHGGHNGTESYLCTYSTPSYTASDFGAKLAELPSFAKLMVMMEQCHSGGFNAPVINNSTADETSISSACEEDRSSIGGAEFDPFARDWISAMTGADPYGAALSYDPDVDGDSHISATEAHDYAEAVKNPYDTPVFDESPVGSGNKMHLGQLPIKYIFKKVLKYLELYRVPLPFPPRVPKKGPLPTPPGPGPYIYDEIIKRLGALDKLLRQH